MAWHRGWLGYSVEWRGPGRLEAEWSTQHVQGQEHVWLGRVPCVCGPSHTSSQLHAACIAAAVGQSRLYRPTLGDNNTINTCEGGLVWGG